MQPQHRSPLLSEQLTKACTDLHQFTASIQLSVCIQRPPGTQNRNIRTVPMNRNCTQMPYKCRIYPPPLPPHTPALQADRKYGPSASMSCRSPCQVTHSVGTFHHPSVDQDTCPNPNSQPPPLFPQCRQPMERRPPVGLEWPQVKQWREACTLQKHKESRMGVLRTICALTSLRNTC